MRFEMEAKFTQISPYLQQLEENDLKIKKTSNWTTAKTRATYLLIEGNKLGLYKYIWKFQ